MGLAYDTRCLVEDIQAMCKTAAPDNTLAKIILSMIEEADVL